MPLARAERERGFFHRRVNPFEQTAQNQIRNRKKCDDLTKDNSVESINVVDARSRLHVQNIARDEPGTSKQKNRRQRNGERR